MAREARAERKKSPTTHRMEGSRRTGQRHGRNAGETERPEKRKKQEKNTKKRRTTSVLAKRVKRGHEPKQH
jgi:hypothetical protein